MVTWPGGDGGALDEARSDSGAENTRAGAREGDRRGVLLLRMLLAQAVRFTTLAMLCEVLECQPGDLLRWKAADAAGG
jgi:Cro/C1-type HTH DNA-binding domain